MAHPQPWAGVNEGQRCRLQSNGDMHSTQFLAHIQGTRQMEQDGHDLTCHSLYYS